MYGQELVSEWCGSAIVVGHGPCRRIGSRTSYKHGAELAWASSLNSSTKTRLHISTSVMPLRVLMPVSELELYWMYSVVEVRFGFSRHVQQFRVPRNTFAVNPAITKLLDKYEHWVNKLCHGGNK